MSATILQHPRSVVEQLEDSAFLEAVMVGLVGAARAEALSGKLSDELCNWACYFGAALRTKLGMTDHDLHGRIRTIAEQAIRDVQALEAR